MAHSNRLRKIFRSSYRRLNFDDFEIWPFKTTLGPLITPFGGEFGHFGANFSPLSDQAISPTEKVGSNARHSGTALSWALLNSTLPKKSRLKNSLGAIPAPNHALPHRNDGLGEIYF